MAIKTFSSTFKTRDDVFDNITPNNMVQPKVSHPAGEWKPAAWLPVQWSGTASKDYFVMSSGKAVALDASGRVVPAGLRLYGTLQTLTNAISNGSLDSTYTLASILAGGTGQTAADALSGITVLTYTATDVKAKTIDITTGAAVTAAKTVSLMQFCQAVVGKGWVREDDIDLANNTAFGGQTGSGQASTGLFEIATNSVIVADIMAQAQQVIELFISECIGVCAYDVYSWAGDTPDSLKFTNYQKQHLIQFITEAQMKVPQMANNTLVTSGTLNGISDFTTTGSGEELPVGTNEILMTRAELRGAERYSQSADDVLYVASDAKVIGLYLGDVAIVPSNSAMPAGASTVLQPSGGNAEDYIANRKSRIKDIKAIGDYFLDAAVGILVIYSADGSTNALQATSVVKYYVYGDAASEAHQHIYFVGRCAPGDHIKIDIESNFTKSTSSSDHRIGRVLEIQQFPKSLMERVTTAWQGSSFDASMRMPGTATKGLPDNLTLTGQNDEVVGNRMVICNIRVL